jgi:hypothetical protein
MMGKWDKGLAMVLGGASDANIRFGDLCGLLDRLRFDDDHHIYRKPEIPEIINIQPLPDGKSKPYQVRQVRGILQRHGLTTIL